jgi:hypothetical protein
MQAAVDSLGFTPQEKDDVFKMAASLMQLTLTPVARKVKAVHRFRHASATAGLGATKITSVVNLSICVDSKRNDMPRNMLPWSFSKIYPSIAVI